VASAATGTPLIDHEGNEIPFRYPTDRPLTIWIIGYGERHIGETIYRLLFKPGVFKVLKDKKTKKMRAYRPWDPEDKKRESECKYSPPLIPERFIDPNGWSWKDKRGNIFSKCTLLNGTEIFAYTSNAKPKMGDPVDIILIDEDIAVPEYVPEWQARLSDRKGHLIWAAFPYSKNNALVEMSDRAKEQADRENPDITETVLKFSDNPFMDTDEVRKRREGWSDEERRARDEGEFITDTFLIYPNYSENLHGIPNRLGPPDKLSQAIDMYGGQIPPSWTRYLALDPGHRVAAVLFAAVPPPDIGDYIVIYDEVYARYQDARGLAKMVREKAEGHVFESFIIDYSYGRQHPGGASKTISEQYADAFREQKLESVGTGYGFQWGNNVVSEGISLVRTALGIRQDGTTRLRTIPHMLPNLKKEFSLYRKRIVNREVSDKPIDRDNHLMDCLRYIVCANPRFVIHKGSERKGAIWRALDQWLAGNKKSPDSDGVTIAPVKARKE